MLTRELLTGGDRHIALVRSTGQSISRGDLRNAVRAAAALLRKAGVGPHHPVAVHVPDPAGFLVACLGVWEAGAVVVPLDTRAGPAWCAEAQQRVHACVRVRDATLDGALALEVLGTPVPLPDPVDLLLFTSGSSSKPKAVMLRGSGLLANVDAILDYLPVRQHPRTAVVLPLSYSYALVGQALTTLRAGGTVLLLGDVPFPAVQLERMAELGAQGLSSVPTSLRLLARAALEGVPRPPLGYVASAGAASDPETFALLKRAFPGAAQFNQYGLTEASPRVTALPEGPALAHGSAGRPLRGVEVWAVAPDGTRLPPGEEGELAVRGPSVMLGYLDDPEETARVLSADGTLRTGDLGHVDKEGYVFVHGRMDGVVKCGGERVGVLEVSAALRPAAGRAELCVVAIPDAQLGHRLVAFLDGSEDDTQRVRQASRGLPPAKRPARFVTLPHFPRTANGKPDLAALRALAEKA